MNTINLNSHTLNRVTLNSVQVNSTGGARKKEKIDYIKFADPEVERICLANFDINGDGKVSFAEARNITDMRNLFQGNSVIKSFNELECFNNSQLRIDSIFAQTNITEFVVENLNVKTATSLFYINKNIKKVKIGNLPYVTEISIGLYASPETIEIGDMPNIKNMSYFVQWADTKCKSIKLGDISSAERMKPFIQQSHNIENIEIKKLPDTDIEFQCRALTKDSVENILQALPVSNKMSNLILNAEAIARYDAIYGDEAYEDALTDKNWMLIYT